MYLAERRLQEVLLLLRLCQQEPEADQAPIRTQK